MKRAINPFIPGPRGTTAGRNLFEALRDLPTGPHAGDASHAAQQETAEESETERLAEKPAGVTEHERSDEDTELVHARQPDGGVFTR